MRSPLTPICLTSALIARASLESHAAPVALHQAPSQPSDVGEQSPATQPASTIGQFPGLIGQQPNPNQHGGAPALLPHLLVLRIPGVEQCPAPDWIKPGMRLTYFAAAATVRSNPNDAEIIEDPNGDITDASGKRWRETDRVADSAGGAGYTIVNIVAVEPGVIVMQSDSYLLANGLQGPATFTSSTGFWTHPSGCDFFLHPKLLKQMPDVNANGVNIMRHDFMINNQKYDAIRITHRTHGRVTNVYDEVSGVLLSQNSSATSAGNSVYRDGYIVNNSANSMVISRYISARNMNLPWANGQMPAWVRTAKHMRYKGARITKSPANIQQPDFSIPLDVDIETTYVGKTFSVYKVTTTPHSASDFPGANDPTVGVAVCGPGSPGGMWMDPIALRQLRTGQVIDNDPTLITKTVVEYVGQGQHGRPIVVIAAESPAQKVTCVYDPADGRLLSYTKADAAGEAGFSTVTQLELIRIE